jgi:ABC-2 type transport system ATP-binding protein
MNETVIQTKKLVKQYGSFTAVKDLNLSIQKGEVFGLLGPNGAGKTTTILMLLGLTEPTRGSVRVLGLDPARQPLRVKARVGYLPDQVGFYDELTALENLIYTARLNGLSGREAHRRIEAAMGRVGLAGVLDKRVGMFSRGMRQRLGVADVLIKEPELIILDEPTAGMDPEGAHEFLQTIRSLKEEGITILLSSHLLYQVQVVCDRVGLFNQGQMVLKGSVPELAQSVLGTAYRISLEAEGESEAISSTLRSMPGVENLRHLNEREYELEASQDVRPEVAQAVLSAGGRLFRLGVELQSLDIIYTRYFEEVEHGNPGRSQN